MGKETSGKRVIYLAHTELHSVPVYICLMMTAGSNACGFFSIALSDDVK